MRQRAILITGASSGIGSAIARALAANSRLFLVARRAERLQALVTQLQDQGCECQAFPADLADPAAPARVAEAALQACGEIEAVINNAGVFAVAPAAEQSAEGLERMWAVNVRAPILLTQALLPQLRAHRGTVVNISSIVTEHAFAGCSAYTASKMALDGWARCLREEERAQGLRVAQLAPGPTDTAVFDGMDLDREQMMRPADVATAVRYVLDLPPTASVERINLMPPAGTF